MTDYEQGLPGHVSIRGDEVTPDPPSRLTWELEEAGPGITKVTTIHDGAATRTKTLEQAAGGMPFILSALKTLLETGHRMA